MRLGCCLNMLGDASDPIGRRYLEALGRLGYDYAELPLAQVMELPEDAFEALISELKSNRLPCECCNNFFPKEIRLTGTEVRFEIIEPYIQSAMHRASRLGAKIIVFGSSGAKNIPDGFPYDKAFEQVVEVLKIVDSYAVRYAIHIAIEPLNRLESNIILNLTDGNRLLRSADFQNIRLLADYYHFMKENDSTPLLRQSMESLVHVHFADPAERTFPTEMKAEYQAFLNILRQGGYTGRMSAEAYSQNKDEDLKNFIRLFKSEANPCYT